MRHEWEWPILSYLARGYRATEQALTDGDNYGFGLFLTFIWTLTVSSLSAIFSVIFWPGPSNNVQWVTHSGHLRALRSVPRRTLPDPTPSLAGAQARHSRSAGDS